MSYKPRITGTDWMSHQPSIPAEKLDEYFREDDWLESQLEYEPECEPEPEPQEEIRK